MFWFELRKNLLNKGFIMLFILYVIVKLFVTCLFLTNTDDEYNSYYDEYTASLYGKTPEQKIEMIENERNRLESVLFQKDGNNINPSADKSAQSRLYIECLYRDLPFKKVFAKVSNIKKAIDIKESAASGNSIASTNTPRDFSDNLEYYKTAPIPDIVSDRGWDFFIYISSWDLGSILLLAGLSGVFSLEYESGMHRLLLSASNGRKVLFRKKLKASAVFVILVVTFFTLFDLILGAIINPLRGWEAPVRSLDTFYNLIAHINIRQYILIYFFVKLFIGFCTASIILYVSSLAKKTYISLIASVCLLGTSVFLTSLFKSPAPFLLPGTINVHQLFSSLNTIGFFNIRIPVLLLSVTLYGLLMLPVLRQAYKRYIVF